MSSIENMRISDNIRKDAVQASTCVRGIVPASRCKRQSEGAKDKGKGKGKREKTKRIQNRPITANFIDLTI